jgi:hypothetical protein
MSHALRQNYCVLSARAVIQRQIAVAQLKKTITHNDKTQAGSQELKVESDVPSGVGSFGSGFDDPARCKRIADDEMTDAFCLKYVLEVIS